MPKTNTTFIMVDIEADGQCPGLYSMVEIGAVAVTAKIDPDLLPTFFGNLRPLPSADAHLGALSAIGRTHEETLNYASPQYTMGEFHKWVRKFPRPMFISDNNGFDWQFVNWYFYRFIGSNPFGYSSTNLGSLYKGMQKTVFANFKPLRKRAHTHNALEDALGNVEALFKLVEQGLDIGLGE